MAMPPFIPMLRAQVKASTTTATGSSTPQKKPHVPCPEDVNDDGTVSVADVLAVFLNLDALQLCTFDVNDDGNVNVTDVLQLLSAFGADC